MCGIVGVFDREVESVDKVVLDKMTDIVSHRGPDGRGIWIDKFIGFGHRRLSIIDLTEAGDQPMKTQDSNFIITYNGEIYNFLDIRSELESKGYLFRSKTDTEVILNAYVEWGHACLDKFNGMFAFAIWDNLKKELFIARDRFGVKPLYYYLGEGLLIFASEIKSILQYPKIKIDVNHSALNQYFTFQNIFTDETLFDGIKLLPPGTFICYKSNNQKFITEKYWDYNFAEISPKKSKNEYIEELTFLINQAVNRQMISDVEIGSYLSGGMDSGSITSIASKHINYLKTFTCGFDLSSASGMELAFDERDRAESLSNKFKTEHYEIVLKAGDMERIMEDLIWHLEDPRVGQSYPNYYVSRLASKFVKVVLSGAGGDELFAGYPWRYYSSLNHRNREDYIDSYYDYWQRLISDEQKKDFFLKKNHQQILFDQTKDIFRNVFNDIEFNSNDAKQKINQSLYFEIKTFLHGLLIVEDKLSMAHSLETRVPFLDNDLVDFAMKVPVQYKLKNISGIKRMDENEPGKKSDKYISKNNDGKIILRNVLSNFIPKNYTKGKKQGFSAPDASWFKGESIDYVKDTLLSKNASIYEYLDSKYVSSLLNEHFNGKKNRRLLIWSLLSFEKWNKCFR